MVIKPKIGSERFVVTHSTRRKQFLAITYRNNMREKSAFCDKKSLQSGVMNYRGSAQMRSKCLEFRLINQLQLRHIEDFLATSAVCIENCTYCSVDTAPLPRASHRIPESRKGANVTAGMFAGGHLKLRIIVLQWKIQTIVWHLDMGQ